MVFRFLENALNIDIFTHAPLPTQSLFPNSYHHTLGRRKLLTPPGSIFSKFVFPTAERDGRKHDLHYQNAIRKFEDDFEHCVIYILYDLQFLQM